MDSPVTTPALAGWIGLGHWGLDLRVETGDGEQGSRTYSGMEGKGAGRGWKGRERVPARVRSGERAAAAMTGWARRLRRLGRARRTG